MTIFSTIKETIALFSGASSSRQSVQEKDNTTVSGIGNHRVINGSLGTSVTPRRPRGRPRKRRIGEDIGGGSNHIRSSHGQLLKEEEAGAHDQEEKKPREETSYKDIYPDLEILMPLRIVDSEDFASSKSKSENSSFVVSSNVAAPPDPNTVPKASFRSIDESTAAAASVIASPIDCSPTESNVSTGSWDNNFYVTRPLDALIKYSPKTEEEMDEVVEYDMDDQDLFWLTEINSSRLKEGLETVSSRVFEYIIDRYDKEWFELTKPLRKYQTEHDDDAHCDKPCDVCGTMETSNSNAIVYCDGCNVAVHQECYGVPHIPESSWLCRKCMLAPGKNIRCLFCPSEEGAFKQTVDNRWAHLFCSHWIDEVCVSNEVYQEPIDHISDIPKARWKLVCSLCRRKCGAPIQCSARFCRVAFHPTCARAANLFMDFEERISYCPKHTPYEHIKNLRNVDSFESFASDADEDENDDDGHEISMDESSSAVRRKKESRKSWGIGGSQGNLHRSVSLGSLGSFGGSGDLALSSIGSLSSSASMLFNPVTGISTYYSGGNIDPDTFKSIWEDPAVIASHHNSKDSRSYPTFVKCPATSLIFVKSSGGALPVLPIFIVNKLHSMLESMDVKYKAAADFDFLVDVAKYWALKRESKRGVHLLTRLLLEPWAPLANASPVVTDHAGFHLLQEKVTRLKDLRRNLEKVRLLSDLVCKRDREKLEMCKLQRDMIVLLANPVNIILRQIWQRLYNLDTKRIFEKAVSAEEAPDYYQIIKQPMDLSKMMEKISHNEYNHVTDMFDDCELMLSNAQLYNRKETVYYKAAGRIRDLMRQMWEFTIENEETLTSFDSMMMMMMAAAETPEATAIPPENSDKGKKARQTLMINYLKDNIFNYHDQGAKDRMREAGLIFSKNRPSTSMKSAAVSLSSVSSVASIQKRKRNGLSGSPKNPVINSRPDSRISNNNTNNNNNSTSNSIRSKTRTSDFPAPSSSLIAPIRTSSRQSVRQMAIASSPNEHRRPKPQSRSSTPMNDISSNSVSSNIGNVIKSNNIDNNTSDNSSKRQSPAFPFGTKLWAKVPDLPYWHPACVINPNSRNISIPKGIREIALDPTQAKNVLVKLYDLEGEDAWAVLPASKVLPLGQSDRLDWKKLSDKTVVRSQSVKKLVLRAYERALNNERSYTISSDSKK